MKPLTGALVGLIALASGAHAEQLTLASIDYSPLMYSERGTVTGCGIRFAAVANQGIAFDGSINNAAAPSKHNLYGSIKVVAQKLDTAGKISEIPLSYAWVKTTGYGQTTNYTHVQSDNPNAYMAFKHSDPDAFMVAMEAVESGFWLGVTYPSGRMDDVLYLPPPKDPNLGLQFHGCMKDLLTTVDTMFR